MEITNLKKTRLEKLDKIKAAGINPYDYSFEKKQTIAEVLKMEGKTIKTAGRMFSFRTHGNIAFADIKDETGKIQIFFQKKLLNDQYKNINLLDIGDFIGVEGEVTKTVAGEISIAPTRFTLLTKSIQPLPSEWFGLKDTETRYRQRYLDLLLNSDIRERFNIRTKVVSAVREYLNGLGFWEVETPTLQPLYGGANAKPFKTHLNALDQDVYLRIADELYLKRLIVGGYEKVYEIAKDFRNEGIDNSHFPEFTMIEWYEAYADYQKVMDRAEGMVKFIAQKIYGHSTLQIEDKKIDIGKEWPRIPMVDILKEKLGLEVEKETKESLISYVKKNLKQAQLVGGETKGQLIFIIFEHTIPQQLEEPTWIIDYPEEVSPLSKAHRSKPGWVERFEGYIAGKEVADGWSELTDPQIQRERFTSDTNAARKDKEEAQHIDEDFLSAMEYGMPPFGGIGIGIDRLTMFFANVWAIKETILFPTLRADQAPKQKEVSPYFQHLKRPEVFTIDNAIKEKFPSISVGVAVIKNVSIKDKDPQLEKEKEELIKRLEHLTTEEIGEFPQIKSYRRLYKATGTDWHSRRPSPEALLRRIALKKGLYTVNTCVDAYNTVVMEHRVSAGAFDLDKIKFPTTLRFAEEGEEIVLLGDIEPTKYKEGEIAYFDQLGGFNIDFNYRDAQRTAVTAATKNLYINVDGVFDISPQEVEKVLKDVVGKIIKYCGGTIEFLGVETTDENTIVKPSIVSSNISSGTMTRADAYSLLTKYLSTKNLIKHCLATEATMKSLAKHFHADENKWGITGLLHDIDWDLCKGNPEKHGLLIFEKEKNFPEDIAHAIKSHNYQYTNVMPLTPMDWSVTCCDELTGIIVAAALVHPDKKLASLDRDFILKRFNEKSFAKGAHRETIVLCEEKLGIPLPEFIEITLKAMQRISNDLGL